MPVLCFLAVGVLFTGSLNSSLLFTSSNTSLCPAPAATTSGFPPSYYHGYIHYYNYAYTNLSSVQSGGSVFLKNLDRVSVSFHQSKMESLILKVNFWKLVKGSSYSPRLEFLCLLDHPAGTLVHEWHQHGHEQLPPSTLSTRSVLVHCSPGVHFHYHTQLTWSSSPISSLFFLCSKEATSANPSLAARCRAVCPLICKWKIVEYNLLMEKFCERTKSVTLCDLTIAFSQGLCHYQYQWSFAILILILQSGQRLQHSHNNSMSIVIRYTYIPIE